jgi:hypothetical protein
VVPDFSSVKPLAIALVMTMSGSGMAGMGLSMQRWRQFRVEGQWLGVYRDFRGPRAVFVVEDKTGLLIGPLDLDVPKGPGHVLTPGAEPSGLVKGDRVSVVYAGIVRADRPIGLPAVEDLSKTRVDRAAAAGPTDGMFVSVEKRGPGGEIKTNETFAQALLGQLPPLVTPEQVKKASLGYWLSNNRARFAELVTLYPRWASTGEFDIELIGTLIFDGIGGVAKMGSSRVVPKVAKLWVAGRSGEAKAVLTRERPRMHFWLGHDRWKFPHEPPMGESAPGQPLMGPFLRWEEYDAIGWLALAYRAPDLYELIKEDFRGRGRTFQR